MKNAIRKINGFTLIELLVIIAAPVAIGLLAPAYQIVSGR